MDLRELFGSDAPPVDVTALAYDNRVVAPGTVFFCVRGMTRDGHEFAPDAIARGAVALVVDGDTFERGIEVPFFSGVLRAPAGPARLAALTGAAVISTHVVRRGPLRFSMGLRTLWGGGNGSGADTRGEPSSQRDPGFVRDLTAAIMKEQERVIEQNLNQWCIFRPLWPDSDGSG